MESKNLENTTRCSDCPLWSFCSLSCIRVVSPDDPLDPLDEASLEWLGTVPLN